MDKFGERLISWYDENKRNLPWRLSTNPYNIWLSEIILQQTRIDQGLAYYLRFEARFPDVYSLAEASRDEVFKLWQGLGYYNRADNMLIAAKTIVSKYDGRFPEDPDELKKIKGIGSYTASAIASIAFGVSVPVVDGNVFRVLSRIFGIGIPIDTSGGRREFEKKAAELLYNHNPGIFNQALMEFGALHCKPKNPNCNNCIFHSGCLAFLNNSVGDFPVKKSKPMVTRRHLYYFVIETSNDNTRHFLIKKRTGKDIWKNLYDFPLIDSKTILDPLDSLARYISGSKIAMGEFSVGHISTVYIHQLTHQKIYARFIKLIVDKKINLNVDNSLLLVNIDKLIDYPVPVLIDRYLKDQGILK